ncbi:MAG: hypothetical protein LBD06_00310 [Candidatus Accumulibacter sp.]|nr:hypothetical protein [Accumulibacter sp.]
MRKISCVGSIGRPASGSNAVSDALIFGGSSLQRISRPEKFVAICFAGEGRGQRTEDRGQKTGRLGRFAPGRMEKPSARFSVF